MSSDVPVGIRATIAVWGRQKRRIWSGRGAWYLDSKGLRRVHVDGYAESFMGKLMQEREGTGQGARCQHWAEVMWGDGLEVQRCIGSMPEVPFAALHLHYVFDPEFALTINQKAALVGLKRTAYLDAVDRSEFWLWARLDSEHRPDAAATRIVDEIIRKVLQPSKKATINSQTGRVTREINLAALGRVPLKLKAS